MVLHGREAGKAQFMFILADHIGLAVFDVVALLADGAIDVDLAAHLKCPLFSLPDFFIGHAGSHQL